MTEILFVIGALGLLGMTWLFPALAFCLVSFRKGRDNTDKGADKCMPELRNRKKSLSILIPAHNEEDVLRETLAGFLAAISKARRQMPEWKIEIVVGADRCTDRTVEVASHMQVRVLDLKGAPGKWRTLMALLNATPDAEYVCLADCGSLWPQDLLMRCLEKFARPQVMAVAPSYANQAAGYMERLFWWLERKLKAFENKSGGPVSLHGATVFYRRRELDGAISELKGQEWLNDDVVVPLMMRGKYPQFKICYLPELVVGDIGARLQQQESARSASWRRRRIALGNLQWICEYFQLLGAVNGEVGQVSHNMRKKSFSARKNIAAQKREGTGVAGLLSLRRIFRLLWCYWVLALAGAIVFFAFEIEQGESLIYLAIIAFIALVVWARRSHFCRELFEAAKASLMIPYYLFLPTNFKEVLWR